MDQTAKGREVRIDPKIRRKEVRTYDTSKTGSLYSHCNVPKVVFFRQGQRNICGRAAWSAPDFRQGHGRGFSLVRTWFKYVPLPLLVV